MSMGLGLGLIRTPSYHCRLGRILLRADPLGSKPLCELARDPVLDPPSLEEFHVSPRMLHGGVPCNPMHAAHT